MNGLKLMTKQITIGVVILALIGLIWYLTLPEPPEPPYENTEYQGTTDIGAEIYEVKYVDVPKVHFDDYIHIDEIPEMTMLDCGTTTVIAEDLRKLLEGRYCPFEDKMVEISAGAGQLYCTSRDSIIDNWIIESQVPRDRLGLDGRYYIEPADWRCELKY